MTSNLGLLFFYKTHGRQRRFFDAGRTLISQRHQFVVEIRRAEIDLRTAGGQIAKQAPRNFLEGGERVSILSGGEQLPSRGIDRRRKGRLKNFRRQPLRFERGNSAQNFAAVIAGQPGRGQRPGQLMQIDFVRAENSRTAVGDKHRPVGVGGEAGKKIRLQPQELMFQPARRRHPCRHPVVHRPSGGAGERVTDRLGSGGRQARHEHPCVQPAGERNAHLGFGGKVFWRDSPEHLTEPGFVIRFRKHGLLLPSCRQKILSAVDIAVFKRPTCAAGQQLHVAKQGAPLQRTTGTEKLRHTLAVEFAEFRQNAQERLGLAGEIKRVRRLMPVNPVQSVAVIKQKNFPPPPVNQQAAEQAVQVLKKLFAFVFVKMDEAIAARRKTVAVLLEPVFCFSFDKTFAGKYEHDVFLFVLKNLPGGEGIFLRHPASVNSKLRRGKGSGRVKRLVFHGCDHGFHGALTFSGGPSANDSDDAGHKSVAVRRRQFFPLDDHGGDSFDQM